MGAHYRRFASRKGRKQAAVIVGHSLLEAIYFILRDQVDYRELGVDYVDARAKARIIRPHMERLESLGIQVEIRELPVAV